MAFGYVQDSLKRTFSTSIKSLTFFAILNWSWWKRKWEYFNSFEMLSSWIIFLWTGEIQHCVDALCSHGLPHLKKHSYQARSQIFKWLFFYYFSLVIVPLRGLHRKSVDRQNAAAIAEPLCGSINMNNISLNPIPHYFGAISSAGCHAVLRTSCLHNYLNEVENKRISSSLWKKTLPRPK